MNPVVERVRALDSRAERLGRSLARAFHEEPNFTYMLPDEARRQRALVWFFGSFVAALGLRHGEVYTTPEGVGGAVWLRPGERPSLWGNLRAGIVGMPLRLGLAGTTRSAALGAHLERLRREVARPLHWYLVALGVDPGRQGSGLGSALLRPVLERADADGAPCYLETFRWRTVAFYDRLGFEVVHADAAPGGGPPFWCMMRSPGA